MKKRTPEEVKADIERAKMYLSYRVWNVERIAVELGYTHSAFSHAFKKYAGVSPINYRLGKIADNIPYKTLKAMRYLRFTDLHLKEVAHRSGFRSYGSFLTSFKRDTNLPPNKYRQQFPDRYDSVRKLTNSKAERLDEAMFLLKTTDNTVEDIACSLGYSNANGLIIFFNRELGITPGQYRERELAQEKIPTKDYP